MHDLGLGPLGPVVVVTAMGSGKGSDKGHTLYVYIYISPPFFRTPNDQKGQAACESNTPHARAGNHARHLPNMQSALACTTVGFYLPWNSEADFVCAMR